MTNQQTPLNEPQLELLQLFARPVDAADWANIKAIITDYFAQKAIREANAVWDTQQWDATKVEQLLHSHLRTPYRK
jgi:hypothetical protein